MPKSPPVQCSLLPPSLYPPITLINPHCARGRCAVRAKYNNNISVLAHRAFHSILAITSVFANSTLSPAYYPPPESIFDAKGLTVLAAIIRKSSFARSVFSAICLIEFANLPAPPLLAGSTSLCWRQPPGCAV